MTIATTLMVITTVNSQMCRCQKHKVRKFLKMEAKITVIGLHFLMEIIVFCALPAGTGESYCMFLNNRKRFIIGQFWYFVTSSYR